MRLNWFGYYDRADGYGRYNRYLASALRESGMDVRACHVGDLDMPEWMLEQRQVDWSALSISCVPPYMVRRVPGRHWLYSMTEGSVVPDKWVECIHSSGVERVLVPCRHNKEAFAKSGVDVPIDVVPGGTDPDEFPLLSSVHYPYTFLCFADRGERKGWYEVWEAFYKAFGGKTTGEQDVRLLVKHLPASGSVAGVLASALQADPRIVFDKSEVGDMRTLYARADCVAIPSRSEGWGMIPREAAMCGLPVITQAYSGMDDGYTNEWALVVEKGQMQPIPLEDVTSMGEWRVVDVDELAKYMRACYDNPPSAASFGRASAAWLRSYQTWVFSCRKLLDLMIREGVFQQSAEREGHLEYV